MKLFKKIFNTKRRVLLLAAAALVSLTVGGVFGYIMAQTEPIANNFNPVAVTCKVEENDFQGVVKENVCIRNTSEIPAYIRVATVATWVDPDGNVLAKAPVEGIDYAVVWGTENWAKGSDGFWYYTKPVAAADATTQLINTMAVNQAPEGYQLRLQILAVAIQAEPDRAVTQAWGVTVDENGTITPN